ncbi:MAG: hypothetical protein ABIJ21_07425 [Nanoarchaeota archaeon]
MEIHYSVHALFRMAERGQKHGLPEDEVRERVEWTLKNGRKQQLPSKKTRYTHYFRDNLTFKIIALQDQTITLILTIIIKRGRP